MKLPRTVAVGSDLISATMPLPINSVVIDNPSGGWLYVVEANDFCPPYTIQWSRDLEYRATAITIRYGKSPANQVSTSQGDPYTVTLCSEFVGNSPGSAQQFIEQFTPVLSVEDTAFLQVLSNPPNQTVIAAIPNKRIRLLTNYCWYDTGFNPVSMGPIRICFVSSISTTILTSTFLYGANHPAEGKIFQGGLDLPVSEGLDVSFFFSNAWWADENIFYDFTYQVI